MPSVGGAQSSAHHGRFLPQFRKFASLVPDQLRPHNGPMPLHGHGGKKGAGSGGIYGSQFYAAFIGGWQHRNQGNNGPTCTLGASYPNSVAVDGKGNLIDPDGGTRDVIVYQGPGMCGSEIGSISDGYGQPSDAASMDAANGTIVVGNIFGTSGAGGISLCSISAGCTAYLTNPAMYEVAGVAQANNGDCWASAIDSSGFPTLTYFQGCSGGGQVATGFDNVFYGGLDIDKAGNLVSIDLIGSGTGSVWVYSGCNPSCSLVGGPFPLEGESVFGHLSKQSMTLATGDFEFGQVDVYNYSPTSLSYSYSFNNGFSPSDDVEGAAFNPRSTQ
ncbi:MAG: hypothetical protein WA814_11235 [Candidatus Baltobacteraceae bacterium]